ncbi:hypothetical protein [Lactococcus petauri]|uniref:hypothetical protein n=1 Tax=Lactococcus petauri TaxID=1940789 RepID=UPI003853EEBE
MQLTNRQEEILWYICEMYQKNLKKSSDGNSKFLPSVEKIAEELEERYSSNEVKETLMFLAGKNQGYLEPYFADNSLHMVVITNKSIQWQEEKKRKMGFLGNLIGVTLVKSDGSTYAFQAVVQSKTIFTEDIEIPIEEGDIIERVLPNSLTEEYIVLDRGYFDEGFSHPAHYQIKVEKAKTPKGKTETNFYNNTNNINASGNAKVNLNSTDHSININITQEEDAKFEELFSVIKSLQNSEELLSSAIELKETVRTETFKDKYISFMANAANHMTVLAPFISFLPSLMG